MRSPVRTSIIAAIALLASLPGVCADDQAATAPTQSPDALIVNLTPCDARRPKTLSSDDNVASLIFGGSDGEKLVLKGPLTIDGDVFDVYLPESKRPYTIANIGRDDSRMENRSTLISIDQNRDGKLTEDESWFANKPIRIADRMYEITAFTADGSRIDLRLSSAPLSGIVLGRKVPPFSYKTPTGEEITQDSFKGKAFLLDIWSVT